MDRELVWSSWFDHEKTMKVFRCARRLFIEMKKNGTPDSARLNIAPGNDLFIPVDVLKQSAGSLKNEISVHVVVEFMDNTMDHPSMFVRFPRSGPNHEFKMLRSMAIRLEWTDGSGHWFTCALTRRQVWHYIDNDPTKVPSIYQVGMKIARVLQCINYTGPRVPGWLTAVGRVVVKDFKEDHLNQELVASNTQTRVKQWPADNTIQQNAIRLQQLVISKGWPTVIGVRPDRMLHGRIACDICVSQATVSIILMNRLICMLYLAN